MHSKKNNFTSDPFLIFDSKESALALKEIVKSCFTPKHFYPEPNVDSSTPFTSNQITNISPITSPSFFKSCAHSPGKIKPGYIKKAAFVSRGISQKSIMQAKREIERTRQQTAKILTKIGQDVNQNQRKIETTIEKVWSKRSAVRSTTTASSSRRLFKSSTVFD